jgi:hypothetical protein
LNDIEGLNKAVITYASERTASCVELVQRQKRGGGAKKSIKIDDSFKTIDILDEMMMMMTMRIMAIVEKKRMMTMMMMCRSRTIR